MMRNAIVLLAALSLGLVGCANQAPSDGSLASRSAQVGAVELDADSNGGLDVARGGTNATTAAGARTNLGVPDTYSEVVELWTACSGYLRSDGTCDTPSGAFSWPTSDGIYYAARNGAWASLAAVFQPLDADLSTWAGVTSSANGRSLVTAANYAAMRTLLDLEVGIDFNAYDPDLASASGAGAAGVSKYWGTNAGGTVGFYDLPSGGGGILHATSDGNYYASKDGAWASLTGLYQGADSDLSSASGASAAGNSKYWGTDSGGAVGFYDLPSGVPSWLPSTGPTADNQIIQASGIGTSAWTSIVDGLINDAGNSTDDLLSASEINTRIATKEAALGNPSTDGYVLSSTTSGVRSWIAAGGGAVDLSAPGPIGSVTPNTGVFTTLEADAFEASSPAPGETGELGLQEDPANGNNIVSLKAPANLANDLIITLPAGVVPASATAPCTAGQWWYDASYWYVCVAENTWLRAALSTW